MRCLSARETCSEVTNDTVEIN